MNFKTLISVLLLILSPFSEVVVNSGYALTCNSLRVGSVFGREYTLVANYRETQGTYKVSAMINLDSCFANVNGKLQARLWLVSCFLINEHLPRLTIHRGRFSNTCDDIKLNGTILRAKCGNRKGGRVFTSIDTSKMLYYSKSVLLSNCRWINTLGT